jgi:hypothetical protein
MADSIASKINFLLNLKFEGQEAGFSISGMSEEEQELEREFLTDVAAYRTQLEAMPESELDIEIEVQEARVLAAQQHRPFFDRANANADFAVWIGMPMWTSDQAAALLLGKEHSIVHWARVEEEHLPESAFARRYGQLKASLESSQAAGELSFPASPNDIVNWARDRRIAVPSALNSAVPRPASHDDVGGIPSGKVAACMEAMQDLWGAVEPQGISQKDRLKAINRWLAKKGRSEVSQSTVKRGWREKYGSQSRSGKLLSRSKRSRVIGPTADSDD